MLYSGATWNGHNAIIRILLAHGADPSAQNGDKDTALHWAAFQGRTSTATLLLDAGADVNSVNANRRTPLLEAAKHGHNGMLKVLLMHGAHPNVQDSLMVSFRLQLLQADLRLNLTWYLIDLKPHRQKRH